MLFLFTFEIMKLVFATNNRHKLDEVRKITAGYTEIASLSDIDCQDDIPETADTLEGNALQKARYIKEHFGYDCFADDTGLEVEALDNAPGVYSARYAGPGHDSEANMNKLLHEMEGKENRKARFRTVIALILNGKEYLFEGIVNGMIIPENEAKVASDTTPYLFRTPIRRHSPNWATTSRTKSAIVPKQSRN